MSKYRSKIVEIEAIQWNGIAINHDNFPMWLKEAVSKDTGLPGSIVRMGNELHIHTLEGVMTASPDDWIIRGTEGELYPCKPSVFARKYEPI